MNAKKHKKFYQAGWLNKDTPVFGTTLEKMDEILAQEFEKQFAEIERKKIEGLTQKTER